MNIKKICELTETGKETLRLYREKGCFILIRIRIIDIMITVFMI